jgi:hypothetical protein
MIKEFVSAPKHTIEHTTIRFHKKNYMYIVMQMAHKLPFHIIQLIIVYNH